MQVAGKRRVFRLQLALSIYTNFAGGEANKLPIVGSSPNIIEIISPRLQTTYYLEFSLPKSATSLFGNRLAVMIIFGTRAYFRTNKVVQHGFCENCNAFGKLQSYNSTNCFHLYFIPIVPIEGRRRTHQMCNKCNFGRAYELPVFEQLLSRLKERSADAVVALLSGEATIPMDDPNRPPIECVGLLHDVVSWLYAANDSEFCQGVLAQLNEPKLRYAQVMTRAAIETAQGNIDAALGSYGEANLDAPKASEPHIFKGRLLRSRKRFDEAIASFQKACSLASPKTEFDLRLQLVDIQTEGKKYADSVATLDWLLDKKPELQSNKPFMAMLKTARKKAGIK